MTEVSLRWHSLPDARPSAAQAGFVGDLAHRNLGLFGGYGSGKTHAGCYKTCVLSALNAGLTVGAVGPDFASLFEDVIPAISMILDCSGIDHIIREDYKKLDILVPKWSGRIKLASANKPRMMKGPNWAAAVGNEPGIWPEEAWLNMSSRVRDPRARVRQIALAGTPEGYNWLYRHTVKKHPAAHLGRDPNWRIWFADTHDASWLGSEYVDDLKDKYPDDLIDEKIHGRFVNVGSGRAYSAFDRVKHTRALEYQPSAALFLCLDFNVAPAIAVVHQHLPHPTLGTVVHALDEVVIKRGSVADVIREFARRWKPRITQPLNVVGDATGTAKHATGLACYDEVWRVLRDHEIEWANCTPSSNPPVADRLAIVNGAIERGRYLVDVKCEELIEDLEQVQYKPGTRDLDKSDPRRTHLSDGAGYDLHRLFGVVAPPPTVTVVRKDDGRETKPWRKRERPPWR